MQNNGTQSHLTPNPLETGGKTIETNKRTRSSRRSKDDKLFIKHATIAKIILFYGFTAILIAAIPVIYFYDKRLAIEILAAAVTAVLGWFGGELKYKSHPTKTSVPST